MEKGKFYGISIGPGDPELITLKALKCIEKLNILTTPRTKGENTLALDIVSKVCDVSQKEVVMLDFLMSRDKSKMKERHKEIAQTIRTKLDSGQDVGMLNLGDVSVYSTFSYIMDILKNDGYQVEIIPGVTSFCAVAGVLQQSLTTMNEPLHIMPASTIEEVIDLTGTKVIMKAGKSMGNVKQIIKEKGLSDRVKGVQNCGLSNEIICKTVDDLSEDASYFTTLIIN